MRISRRDLERPAEVVAPTLLGARLVSTLEGRRVVIRITEVEAYAGVGQDAGSHAHRGQTARNSSMFGKPGSLYVYFTYGMHWCANVVCGPKGQAAAVLLRGGEVIDGVDHAFARRPSVHRIADLARGPARLASAAGISGVVDGADLLSRASHVRLVGGPPNPARGFQVGPRTGVAGSGASAPWRFWLDGEPTVSPYRRAAPRATR